MTSELELWQPVRKSKHLRFRSSGDFTSDMFSFSPDENTFTIVNSDNSREKGIHPLLFCNRDGDVSCGDPLGLQLYTYTKVCSRLICVEYGFLDLVNHQLGKFTSNLCGLYCIFIAQYVFIA